jgi:hypothetical protein
VVSGLPSAISNLPSGDTDGASDVVFLGDNLYVLVAGGGCSHGNPDAPAGIVRAKVRHGTWDYIADLSAYVRANPVADPIKLPDSLKGKKAVLFEDLAADAMVYSRPTSAAIGVTYAISIAYCLPSGR